MYETCTEESCNRRVYARGWCRKHYERWRSGVDPKVRRVRGKSKKSYKKCLAPDCTNDSRALGLCRKHYDWQRAHRPYGLHVNPPDMLLKEIRGDTCGEKDCDLPRYALGRCKKHYMRWYMRNRERWRDFRW